jgi:hypothetical protein
LIEAADLPMETNYVGTNGRALTTTLPAVGTYSVVVDPQGAATGRMTLALG